MSLIARILRQILGDTPHCTAVIAAAGSSERMGGEDKIFTEICGAPVIVHTLLAFSRCESVNDIIVVTRKECVEKVAELCRDYNIVKATKVMVGGATRLESVINGVYSASWKSDLLAIHDGARPCVDEKTIEKTIRKASKKYAAAPGIPVISTLKKVEKKLITETIDRQDLVEIQTPQIFNADLIKGALTKALKDSPDITDDCMAAELIGLPVYITEGSRNNIKITTTEDLSIAETILARAALSGK